MASILIVLAYPFMKRVTSWPQAVLGLAFARNIEAIRQWLQHTFGIVLFDQQLYLLAEMPSHITWVEVGAIAGMAMFFSLAASIYPAWRAAQLDPVEGLRRE